MMLRNYSVTAVRALFKHKGYTIINVVGLATGMACFLLIALYITDELSYDRYHERVGQIYRFTREFKSSAEMHLVYTPLPLVPALTTDFPGIETMRVAGNGPWSLMRYEDIRFQETRIYWADKNIFRFFSLPLVKGNPATALREPNSIVITEDMAAKYFSGDDPMGKLLHLDNTHDLRVTGVMKNVPHNTHFRPDFLASLATLIPTLPETAWKNWGSNWLYTYFIPPPGYSIERFRKEMPAFLKRHAPKVHHGSILHIDRITDIHLHSHLEGEFEANGNSSYIYAFGVIALFILAIACVNFMNLATARSGSRAREVGVRKALGAQRKQLAVQFLGESVLLSMVALVFAFVLIELLLPVFNNLTNKQLSTEVFTDPWFIVLIILFGVLVGIIAGSYPAFVLSSFRPAHVLKGVVGTTSGAAMRRVLVVVQFSISTILIIGTLVVFGQVQYLKTKQLGLNREQVLIGSVPDNDVNKKMESLTNAFREIPGVVGISRIDAPPAGPLMNSIVFIPADRGNELIDDANAVAGQWVFRFVVVGDKFFTTLGIPMVTGREFSSAFATDSTALIINESAVRQYGWKSPQEAIGKMIVHGYLGTGKKIHAPIVGVVRDFHFESLHEPIKPLVFLYRPNGLSRFIVKMNTRDITATMASMQKTWNSLVPNWPMVYSFLDDDYNKLYHSEELIGQLIGYFTILAIFIACLGLFGLVAFTAERRTKEIGIRKVLGASVSQIVVVLSKEFTRLVLIACVVAIPIGYLVMSRWLEDFAYRIEPGIETGLLAALPALFIAWLTVGYHAVKAAMRHPVQALRYE